MRWPKELSKNLKINEPLSRHTTLKIGGPVSYFFEPRDECELKKIIFYAKEKALPIFVIGNGSNILAPDKKLRAVMIRLSAPYFRKITFHGSRLQAFSGAEIKRIIDLSAKKGLCGLEFLSAVPATLGGALAMNAAAFKKSISEFVVNMRIMDYNGKIRLIDRKSLRFKYRSCGLRNFIILNAALKLKKSALIDIRGRIKKYQLLRKTNQDYSAPSAGCVFKNPSNAMPAGRLIDLCGLKGRQYLGACISNKHANFILNKKRASSSGVKYLMRLAQRKVKERFALDLKPEIKIWQ